LTGYIPGRDKRPISAPNHKDRPCNPPIRENWGDFTGENFGGRIPTASINFEEILSRAQGNFEEKNKLLKSYTNYY